MINNHVVSLDLAKQLYEAGIKIESEFWWQGNAQKPQVLLKNEHEQAFQNNDFPCYPAPLASELGELLPDSIFTSRFRAVSLNHQVRVECLSHIEEADTEANARAKMLLYLKSKGIL